MSKNIMLLFLSPVHTVLKDDKIIISKTTYENLKNAEQTETTNESAVRYLQENLSGESLSKIFILASKSVRENLIGYRNDNYLNENGEPVTHLDYFKNRMKKFLPDDSIDIFDIYNYDEKSDDEKNLKSIAEIAERIQSFVNDNGGEEITLHVDLTGGLRNVNMMMLEIIRLLNYSGIKIGKLLYSNYDNNKRTGRVEEQKNIYDLFQLISGVEEFVQFGSVKALDKYYDGQENLSTGLKKLIAAMDDFAAEIKLCHYGKLETAIKNLHDAINDFNPNPNNLHDALMSRLIGRIKADYSKLLRLENRKLDDLRVIRWCVENDYLQQALTFYTERIPEYLGKKNVMKLSPANTEKINEELKEDNRNFWFYVLDKYYPHPDDNKKIFTNYYNEIRNAVIAINKKKFNFDTWWGKFNVKLQKENLCCEDEQALRAELELLQKLKENPEPLNNLDAEELKPLRPIIEELKPQFIEETQGIKPAQRVFKLLKIILNFVQEKITKDDVKKYFPYLEPTKLGETIIMVDEAHEKFFLSAMKKYFVLKKERNQSNHARADMGKFGTPEELSDYIKYGLDEIEKVLQK